MKIENCKLKISTNYSGFSLMELIIVITIMGIMSGVGFISLQSSKVDSRLKAAQGEVSATIKLAQSYALQGKIAPDGSGKSPCGYGFRFTTDASHYEIFYNKQASGDCTAFHLNPTNCHYKAGTSVTLESGILNNNVVLNPFSSVNTEVYFKIPFGGVYDNTGGLMLTPKDLVLSYSSSTKKVTINPNGSVDENN